MGREIDRGTTHILTLMRITAQPGEAYGKIEDFVQPAIPG
jgi:hypothetical protein